MRSRRLLLVCALLTAVVVWSRFEWPQAALAEPVDEVRVAELRKHARVVLITIDGPVREDVFDATLMPRLHAALGARHGVLLPARASSSMALSLPGYQALAMGRLTDCMDNDCPRVGDETVAEFLARRVGGGADQFSVFASWSRLPRAASSRDGTVRVDAPQDVEVHAGGPPWWNARFDAETFSAARAHWEAFSPRFMQLSLLDTDEWAHAGYRREYETALRAADDVLGQVFAWVDALPPEERALTTVLVTADHGRGRGDWREHGFFERGSAEIFFAAFPARGEPTSRVVDQRDVRPTIERLFGFCTEARRRSGDGRPIGAVVGELPCAE
jgi:hypothetical protein